jgi:hypothetical protein
MTKTKAPAAPQTHRSGHCGLRNPPVIHAQCRGLYSGYPCRCECHTTPGLEDTVVAELRRALRDDTDLPYQVFLHQLARNVIAIVRDTS